MAQNNLVDTNVLTKLSSGNGNGNGNGGTLPENFDKLSKSKQQDAIKSTLQDIQVEIVKRSGNIKKNAEMKKKCQATIKQSKVGAELARAGKSIKRDNADLDSLFSELKGVLRLCRKFGLDMSDEVKALKQLND